MKQVELKNISFFYDNTCILQDINFSIDKGDYIYITGPNGGGKTTLLKIILGMNAPAEGNIIYPNPIKFGYVPQFSSFNRTYPVTVENVVLTGAIPIPLTFFHRYSDKDKQDAKILMEKLKIDMLKNKQISQLSGGQLQRVLFTRALMTRPDILVLDEPTSNLDNDAKKIIDEFLDHITPKITIIQVSHEEKISSHVNKVLYINRRIEMKKN